MMMTQCHFVLYKLDGGGQLYLNLVDGNAGVFGIAAIKFSAHAAHCCCDGDAFLKFTARRILNESHGLDAQNSRKRHIWRVTLLQSMEV
jgi:hypothetical protein